MQTMGIALLALVVFAVLVYLIRRSRKRSSGSGGQSGVGQRPWNDRERGDGPRRKF